MDCRGMNCKHHYNQYTQVFAYIGHCERFSARLRELQGLSKAVTSELSKAIIMINGATKCHNLLAWINDKHHIVDGYTSLSNVRGQDDLTRENCSQWNILFDLFSFLNKAHFTKQCTRYNKILWAINYVKRYISKLAWKSKVYHWVN